MSQATSQTGNWTLQYFPGGRELMQALGQQLVVGESFAFLGPQWGRVPMIASILRAAGVEEAPPRIFPLWGEQEITLPGARLRQRPVPRGGMCSLWTDRQLYREGRDPIRVIMSDPFRPQTQVDLSLLHEGKPFARQPLLLDEYGMCIVELQDLPAGRYRLQADNALSKTEFVVAIPRISTMSAEWIQQYTQAAPNGRVLVFVLQLESFGLPLQGDIAIQLLDESGDRPQPLGQELFRADGGGRVAGELLLKGDGPFSLEIHALSDSTKWCSLQVTQEASPTQQPKRTLICPLGGVKTWCWSGENGLLGFEVEDQEIWNDTPMVLVGVSGQQAVLRAELELTEVMLLVLDPVTGQLATHQHSSLSPGRHIEVALPRPGGVIAIGGWLHEQPWEGWTLAIPPATTSLELSLLPREHHKDPLFVELRTDHQGPLPVYVVVREAEEDAEERPWGPSGSLVAALHEITQGMSVHTPTDELWRVAQKHKRVQEAPSSIRQTDDNPPGQPPRLDIPRPSSPPPVQGNRGPGIPPPQTPPPGASQAPNPSPEKPKMPTWERPIPQHEHFSKTLYCGLLSIEGRYVLSVDLPDEQMQVQVEAVGLAGPSWAYARAESAQCQELFVELLLPGHAHPEDALTGEAILVSQHGPLYVDLRCDGQPVPLYQDGAYLPPQTPLEGELIQLTYPVIPGTYLLQVRDQHGVELEQVEADVSPWGIQQNEGWGVQLLPAGTAWSPSADITGEALPDLRGVIQRVARNLLERPSGHCETEAARVCAAAYSLQYAQAPHEQSMAYHYLLQALERLEGMRVPGMGFRLTPGGPHEPRWGVEAVYHLWELGWLTDTPGHELPEWHQRILQIADEMAYSYKLPPIPTRIHSARDAYRVFQRETTAPRKEEALWEIEKRLQETPDGRLQLSGADPIEQRKESCFGAMVLLSSEDSTQRQRGLILANWALHQWRAEEAGFSTGEGVALLSLLGLCQRFLPPYTQATAQLNGHTITWQQLTTATPVTQLQVTEGIGILGLRYPRLRASLDTFTTRVPWQLRLQRPGLPTSSVSEAEVGDRLNLAITLSQGGQIGDILEFFLPPSLCWLDGERDEKHFAVEITGKQQIDLPLIAVATTQTPEGEFGPQHWGVRLMNLYDSTRGNASLEHTITIHPPGHRRREQGMFRKWRKIFG